MTHYSKSTKRGIVVFTLLLLAIFVAPDLIQYFRPKPEIRMEQWSTPEKEVTEKLRSQSGFNYHKGWKKKRFSRPLSKFDPNQYSLEEWMALGLSEKQSAIVLKFTSRKIYSNEELKRIFVISDELFQLIKDSTYYPERTKNLDKYTEYKLEQKLIKVDINRASLDEVLQAAEITAFDAKQIIRTRDNFGGFYSLSQLSEVWQATPEKIAVWEKYIRIDPENIRTMNINTASAKELSLHPYISWNLANSLVKLRSQNGFYKELREIKKSVLMTDELYEKLKYYLIVE
ncbi:helix-hairpin-helix domain-containing protein [Fluviicola taffensis]|uniref:helix-hairpin-helix domain-containing protein n=1 Tax=Fluviicola taffensis TaxID=191579 RepID=UPI0031383E53